MTLSFYRGGLRVQRVQCLASGRVVKFLRSLYRGDADDFAAELQIAAEEEGTSLER
jgi:GntR family transcriptional regulator, N-acetylglucosamine utilization regulator